MLENHEIFSTITVAELDGDNEPEIVFGTDLTGDQDTGQGVFALNLDGTPVAGIWPVILNADVRSSPAVADLDLDGLDEIVIGTYGIPNTLLILDQDGSLLGKVTTSNSIISSPALADLNGDRIPEIIVGTSDATLMVLKADGTSFSSAWPITLPLSANPIVLRNDADSSPAVGDLDGDGSPEIVILTDDGILFAYHTNGTPLHGFPFVSPRNTYPIEVDSSINSSSPCLRS